MGLKSDVRKTLGKLPRGVIIFAWSIMIFAWSIIIFACSIIIEGLPFNSNF